MWALKPDKGLPCEDSPAPDLFASVLQQLWGTSEGGSEYGPASGDVSEPPNDLADAGDVVEEAVLGEDVGDVVEEEILEEDVTEEIGEEIYDDIAREVDIVQAWPTFNTTARDMTAANGPDLQGGEKDVEPHRPWHFDFGDVVGGHHDDGGLTDEETIILAASAATLCCRGCTLEPHKIGMPVWNPGPPFAIGDVIISNVGNDGLQWAFVRMAEDPRYELFLEQVGASCS